MDLRNHAPVSADGKTVSAWREQPAPAAAEISGRARSACRHARDLRARLPAAGVAVAVGRGDHPMGCEIAVLSAGAIPRRFAGARRMAVVVAERLCRLGRDLRSAVAAVLAAACPARRVQPGGQPARIRCRDLRLSVSRRCRHHPVLSRPRLACRRGAGGGDGICARRFRECAHAAHRPDHQPGLPAARALARRPRARAIVLARGVGGRRAHRA